MISVTSDGQVATDNARQFDGCSAAGDLVRFWPGCGQRISEKKYRRRKRVHDRSAPWEASSATDHNGCDGLGSNALTRFGSRYHPSLDDGRDNRTHSRDSRRSNPDRNPDRNRLCANADHANAV